MSHYCALLFYNSEGCAESIMEKFQDDNEEYYELSIEFTKGDAQKEFDALTKKEKKEYGTVDKYMSEYHYCRVQDEEGNYCRNSNPHGVFDYYEIGGRWNYYLFHKLTKKEKKEIQDEDLFVKEDWRDNLKEYIRLKLLSPEEYCIDQKKSCGNEYMVSEVDWNATLESAKKYYKNTTLEHPSELFYNYFCEKDDYVSSDGVEAFEKLIKKYKKGYVAVIDYHI